MSNFGQIGLSIVGFAVGAALGNPALGFYLGSLAGQLVFPTELPTIQASRLADLGSTQSTVGAPILKGWGTFPAPGNVIWQSDMREVVTTEEVGGKGGGGQEVETVTYYQDFAIGICEGPIVGIRRIWANGKLIYDRGPIIDYSGEIPEVVQAILDAFGSRQAASDQLDEIMTVYLGDETQLPDPTIEAHVGVDNISAFRGLAYVVFTNWQNKDEDGRKMPLSWKFEVMQNGTFIVQAPIEYTTDVLYPWVAAAYPVNDSNVHEVKVLSKGAGGNFPGSTIFDTVGEARAAEAAASGRTSGAYYGYSIRPYRGEWVKSITTVFDHPLASTVSDYDAVHVAPRWNPITADEIYLWDINGPALSDQLFESTGFSPDVTVYSNGQWMKTSGRTGVYTAIPGDNYSQASAFVIASPIYDKAITTFARLLPLIAAVGVTDDSVFTVKRLPRMPDDPCVDGELPNMPGFGVSASGSLVRCGPWIRDNDDYRVLAKYLEDDVIPSGYSSSWRTSIVSQYPLNPTLPETHPDYNNQTFWDAAYAEAVARGDMPSGLSYGSGYGRTVNYAYYRELSYTTGDIQEVPIADIITDLHLEAGDSLENFDVTDLEATEIPSNMTVIGYVRTRVMSARSAIEPLRSIGFFDAYESQGRLKYIRRGKPTVAALPEIQMGAYVDGEVQGTVLRTRRKQDFEIPRQIRVHYLSLSRDHEPGEQSSPVRTETDSVHESDIDLVAVLTDERAARIAETIWADVWASRWFYETTLDQSFQHLEPTDCLEVPVDGQVERMRIVNITDSLPSIRKLEMVRDDDGSYISYAAADTPFFTSQDLAVDSPTGMFYLDIPKIRDEDEDAGLYVAAYPQLVGGDFVTTLLMRSADDGNTYQQATTIGAPTTSGVVVAPLPVGPTDTWDEEGTLVVELYYGTLANRTEAEVLGGANSFAIGRHGQWMIGQFRNATLVNGRVWTLSGILQGRRGTEHFTGLNRAGDGFVMLSMGGLLRVPLINALWNVSQKYKPVLVGQNIASTPEIDFTSSSVSLLPFSPVQIEGFRNADGSVHLSWSRRDRSLTEEMAEGADIPMSETSLLFDVELYQGTELVATLNGVTEEQADVSVFGTIFDMAVPNTDVKLPIAGQLVGVGRTVGQATLQRHSDTGSYLGGMFIGQTCHAFVANGADLYVAVSDPANVSFPQGVYRILRTNLTIGAVLTTAATHAHAARGLAFDGTDLWVAENGTDQLHRLNASTLASIGTLAMPGSPGKMVFDAGDLHICCKGTNEISVVDASGPTEILRFTCVSVPSAVVVTTQAIFVQGASQVGVYFRASGIEIITHNIQAATPEGEDLVYDGNAVLVFDIATSELVTLEPTTGLEVGRRSLPDFTQLSGYANSDHFVSQGTGGSATLTRALEVNSTGTYEVRIYQRSNVVGRGTPGVETITPEQDEVIFPDPLDINLAGDAIILPLRASEEDEGSYFTWTRNGDGPRITDQGMMGDGYQARLRATTGLPAFVTTPASPLTMRATFEPWFGARHATRDIVVSVCENDATAEPKLELAVMDDPTAAAGEPQTVFRGSNGTVQVQRMARRNWKFEFPHPEKLIGANLCRPYGVLDYDGTSLLATSHYNEVVGRCHRISKATGVLLGAFTFPVEYGWVHPAAIARRPSDSSIWFADFSTGEILLIDVEASLASGTAVIQLVYTLTADDVLSGIEWVEFEGQEYLLFTEYLTAGTPYLYQLAAALVTNGGTFNTADREKRLTIPVRSRGIAYSAPTLYMAHSTTSGGLLYRIDVDSWMSDATGVDGDAYSLYQDLLSPTTRPVTMPSAMAGDIALDDTGTIWSLTEGMSAEVDDQAFLACWSMDPSKTSVFNCYQFDYDGVSLLEIWINDRLFTTQTTWDLSAAVPAAISVGGPPQAADGQLNGFMLGMVREVVIQDQPLTMDDHDFEYTFLTTDPLFRWTIDIENPGAETGDATGWTVVVGGLGIRELDLDSPDPVTGRYFFNGGVVTPSQSIQRHDLLDLTELTQTQVDAGGIWVMSRWQASVWIGQSDQQAVGFRFYTDGDTLISEELPTLLGMDPTDTWIPRSYGVEVPAGTRYVEVTMRMVRLDGTNNNGNVEDMEAYVFRRST